MAGAPQTVVVLGGTGFLGRRVVGHLIEHGFAVRVAVRHPERAAALFPEDALLKSVRADVDDEASIAQALVGAWGVVNAVSLYAEKGGHTFHSVHVEAAARVATVAHRAGVQRLIQMSGLGADPNSSSGYIRSRGEGEIVVREAFPGAIIIRPSAMFDAEDGLTASIAGMLRTSPVFPMFGTGATRLQPVFVEDVAEAIARIMAAPAAAPLYELGGPEVLTYKALLQTVARRFSLRRMFLPVPFAIWRLLAILAERLPNPPVTTGMVALMEEDNVVSARFPGFEALGIAPRALTTVLGGENA
jgi:NADH dehydrogenase